MKWPEPIESKFQAWAQSFTPIQGHAIDTGKFYAFVWECVYDPENRPTPSDLGDRLEREWESRWSGDVLEEYVMRAHHWYEDLINFAQHRPE